MAGAIIRFRNGCATLAADGAMAILGPPYRKTAFRSRVCILLSRRQARTIRPFRRWRSVAYTATTALGRGRDAQLSAFSANAAAACAATISAAERPPGLLDRPRRRTGDRSRCPKRSPVGNAATTALPGSRCSRTACSMRSRDARDATAPSAWRSCVGTSTVEHRRDRGSLRAPGSDRRRPPRFPADLQRPIVHTPHSLGDFVQHATGLRGPVRHRRHRVLVEREGVRAGRAPDPGRAGRRRAGRRRRYLVRQRAVRLQRAAAGVAASRAGRSTPRATACRWARPAVSRCSSASKTAQRRPAAARLRRIQRRAPHVRAASRRPGRAAGDGRCARARRHRRRRQSATSTCTAPRRRPTTRSKRRPSPRCSPTRCTPVRPRAGPGTRSARPASSNRCSRCSRSNTACCRASSTARTHDPACGAQIRFDNAQRDDPLRDEQFLRLRRQQLLAGVRRAHDARCRPPSKASASGATACRDWAAARAFVRDGALPEGRARASVAATAGAQRAPPRAGNRRGRAGSRAGRLHRRRPRSARAAVGVRLHPRRPGASPITCARRSRPTRARSRPRASTTRCTTPPPATGPSARAAPQPTTAISAYDASFAEGLLEALVQLAAGERSGAAGRLRRRRRRAAGCRSRTAAACSAARWCCRARAQGDAPRIEVTLRRGRHAAPTTARLSGIAGGNAMAPMLPLFEALAACACDVRNCSPDAGARCRWESRMADMTDLARRTCVVIPALNEALRIREVVEGALAQCPNVIVIDDGSDDGTAECVADLPVVLLRHEQRQGKGASPARRLRRSLAARLRRRADDGRRRPAPRPTTFRACSKPRTCHPGALVIGSRLRKRAQQPTHRRLANEFGDWGISWGCGYRIADTPERPALLSGECLRARRRARRGLRVRSADPDFGRAQARRALRVGADRIALPGPGRRRAVPHEPLPPVARPVPHHLARRRAGPALRQRRRRIPPHARAIRRSSTIRRGEFARDRRSSICTSMQERP